MHSRNHPYSSNSLFDCETIEGLSVRRLWGARKRFHECHRCKALTPYVGRAPYCSECNWDSLTDVAYRHSRLAA